MYNKNMENIGHILGIIGFIGGLIALFVKAGEYKSSLNSKIDAQAVEIQNIKDDLKKVKDDVEKSEKNIANFEAMLIEIKTKLEILLQYSGIFNGIEGHKK